jgi:hypothetical protein
MQSTWVSARLHRPREPHDAPGTTLRQRRDRESREGEVVENEGFSPPELLVQGRESNWERPDKSRLTLLYFFNPIEIGGSQYFIFEIIQYLEVQ